MTAKPDSRLSRRTTKRLLPISRAANFLGVSIDTLRNWEEAGLVIPFRSKGGIRRYSLTHLKIFRQRHPKLAKKIDTDTKADLCKPIEPQKKITPSEPEVITISTYQPSITLPKYIKVIAVGMVISLGTIFLLTSLLTTSYLVKPEQTKSLLGSQGSVASSLGENQEQQVLGAEITDSSPLATIYQLPATILQPFNSLAQGIIQTIKPDTAREIGLKTTNDRLDNIEQANKEDKQDRKLILSGIDDIKSLIKDDQASTSAKITASAQNLQEFKEQIAQRVTAKDAFVGKTIIDSYGSIYPTTSYQGSLGTSGRIFGNLYVSSANILGSATLGNTSSDTIKIIGRLNNDLIPSGNGDQSLGDSDHYWKKGYINTITSDTGGFTSLSVGANFTSAATTVNLINTTATTLNIGGAATTVSLGASTGTTTINNNLSVTGSITGDVTGDITGNADTATALQTARTIGGVSFDGTANITVASATGGFTVSGGNLALGTNSLTMTGSLGATGARVTKGWFTDLEVTNMPTVSGVAMLTISSTDTLTNKTLTSPKLNEDVALTSTSTKLNYLTSAGGTTGTTTTNIVFSTSPTIATPVITTSATVPLLMGSTSADGTLTLEGNNAVAANTATAPNLIFKVGDSAGTTAMTILNNGNVGIGTTDPGENLEISGDLLLLGSSGTGHLAAGSILTTASANVIVNLQEQWATSNTERIGVSVIADQAGSNTNWVRALKADVRQSSTGTLANAAGLYVVSPTVGEAITTAYGLYIESQKPTGVTTAYGIYSAGTSDLNYFGGNVGIGTTAPPALLSVVGGLQSFKGAAGAPAAGSPYGGSTPTLSLGVYGTTDGDYSWLQTYNGPLVLNQLGNNVGIGTTNPISLLNMKGGSTFTMGGDGTSGNNTIYLRGDDTGNTATIELNHYGYEDYYIQAGTAGNGLFSISPNTGGNSFVMNGSGNVGIGTTNPGYKLEVVGTVYPTASIANATDNLLRMTATADVQSGIEFYQSTSTGRGALAAQSTSGASTQAGSAGDILLYAANNLVITTGGILKANERMRITSGGNVGIGTTNPIDKLHVYGGNLRLNDGVAGSIDWQIEPQSALNFTDREANVTKLTINKGETGSIAINAAGGNVGIGDATPDYGLDVVADVNSDDCFREAGAQVAGTCTSDMRLKENIQLLTGSLDKILQLKPVEFEWREWIDELGGTIRYVPGRQVGLIAQDVQGVLPHLVKEKNGYLSVEYNLEMQMMLINAIQEQQAEINTLIATQAGVANLNIDSEGKLTVPEVKTDKLVISLPSTDYRLPSLQSITGGIGITGTTGGYEIDVLTLLGSISEAILGIQTQESTTSAQLASLEETVASQSGVIANVSEAISNQSSALVDLQTQVASLSSKIASSPSANAQDPRNDTGLNLTPPDLLLATSSATLANLTVTSDATISGQLVGYDLSVQNTFKALGNSFLGNTTIAGDLSVDGTLSLTGDSINSISTLYIQNSALATLVDFFNGLVTIDNTGTLTAQTISAKEVITDKLTISNTLSAASSGIATIPAGETSLVVENTNVEENSLILLTPHTSLSQTLGVADRVKGGFGVTLSHPETGDTTFDYLIVGVK